jgi:hypothetical protein
MRFPTVFNPTLQIIFFAAQILSGRNFFEKCRIFLYRSLYGTESRLVECGYFWAAKKELTVSVTGCHFTGPIALRTAFRRLCLYRRGSFRCPMIKY